jgi:hypothetical protein
MKHIIRAFIAALSLLSGAASAQTYVPAPPVAPVPITNSLGANVSMSNTANYFDGPSVAQGTAGKWFASGTVTLADSVVSTFYCKLWDGTTVIASTSAIEDARGNGATASLSGFITGPADNIRISCRDVTSVNGVMLSNTTGNSKDSTLTAFRIQ